MTEVNEFMRENTSWFNKLIRNYPEIKNTPSVTKKNKVETRTHSKKRGVF